MEYKITQGTVGVRPNVTLPNPEILNVLGEDGMRELTRQHYEILRHSEIKDLFPPFDAGIKMAVKHASDFFIQICGGQRHFDQNRGRPMMAARHSPFKIDQKARVIWLEAYAVLLEDSNLSEELKESFWNYLDIFSIWMMNTRD